MHGKHCSRALNLVVSSSRKNNAIEFNTLVAKDEALSVGGFRDGQVTIQGVEYLPPPPEALDRKFDKMLETIDRIDTTLDRAVTCFAICARSQFFFDGNKRTAQLLMNGMFLSDGQHCITIPVKDQREYFSCLREFYETNNNSKLARFLKARQLDKIMKAREREQRD